LIANELQFDIISVVRSKFACRCRSNFVFIFVTPCGCGVCVFFEVEGGGRGVFEAAEVLCIPRAHKLVLGEGFGGWLAGMGQIRAKSRF
jgi:hypothetical protein